MKLKSFNNFLIEDVKSEEKIENKIEDTEDKKLPFEPNEEDNEELEVEEKETSEISDYNKFNNSQNLPTECCKIVIINGCSSDSDLEKMTSKLIEKYNCEEIFLYHLNIQSHKKQEPKDGMMQVYKALECADAIIFACETTKGKLSDIMETAITRIKNHYSKGELKNKVFGCLVLGNEEKVKSDLVLLALNDLHMIVCSDCLCFYGKSSENTDKMMKSIQSLSIATSMLRNPEETLSSDEIKTFDEFDEKEELEEPEEKSFGNSFVDDMKSEMEDNEDLEDEDNETEEEEERLIDNENGTITQIHKGEKITENIDILSFDDFFKNK